MTLSDSSWQERLAARWKILGDALSDSGSVTSPLPLEIDGRPVLASIDQRGGHHLLVPMPPGSSVVEDSQAAHIRIRRTELVIDGVLRLFADVACEHFDLTELFDDVLADILDRLAEGGERPDIVCKHVLDAWRELLRRRGGLLGEEALRGLFGELVVLERILDHSGHADVWTGPDRAPHDFRLRNGDLEVKAIGAVGSEIEIHGIAQLDVRADGQLHLLLVRLATTPTGTSLPELVERVRSKVDDRGVLAKALSKAGYVDSDADHYNHRRFAVLQVVGVPVGSDFPRITSSSLVSGFPDEITSLTYTLDVSAYLPSGLTGDQLGPLFAMGSA